MATTIFYPTIAGWTEVDAYSTSFSDTRSKSTATNQAYTTGGLLNKSLTWDKSGADNTYHITRVHLIYDTSAIKVGGTISSATLSFYAQKQYTPSNQIIYLVQDDPTSTSSIVAADYGRQNTYTTSGGSHDFGADSTSYETNTISLNATALGWLVKGGYSKLGLRQYYDINNTDWGGGYQSIWNFRLGSATPAERPFLTITYENPPGEGSPMFFSTGGLAIA